jgi:hypothetical protein
MQTVIAIDVFSIQIRTVPVEHLRDTQMVTSAGNYERRHTTLVGLVDRNVLSQQPGHYLRLAKIRRIMQTVTSFDVYSVQIRTVLPEHLRDTQMTPCAGNHERRHGTQGQMVH